MRLLTILAIASLSLATAEAAPQAERVRGTIERTDDGSISIKLDDGRSETIALTGDTKFAWVVKSSLDAIKDGTFVGTATKEGNPPTALEVVLFPESMRGTGEGHYPWDEIQDTTADGGHKIRSAMTNGTVSGSPGGGVKVKSAMTNGTVAKSSGTDGQKTLTISYGKDGVQTVAVPASAPVVAFEAADRSIVTPGAKAFVVAAREDGAFRARRVAVGKDGLRPPM